MEAVLVGALLNTAMPTVLKVLDERSKLHEQIKADLQFIEEELPIIASTIDQHQSSKRIEQLRRLAHDIEVCIGLFAYKKVWKRHRRRLFRHPARRRDPVGSLSGFASRLHELRLIWEGERTAQYAGPSPVPVPIQQPAGEPILRDMGDTVGLAQRLGHLLELLQPPGSGEQADPEDGNKVISVVGPGGVGKTLLAARAYFRVRSDRQFSPCACVCAADRANEDVLWDILRRIGGSQYDRNTLSKRHLIQLIQSYLRGQRYLIVVDNVRKVGQWEDMKSAFPDTSQVSSRVIVTTAIQSVADVCSSPNGYIYKMEGLSNDDSARLFIREVALNELPGAVLQASAGLRRKCDGLPLALVSIAHFVQVKGGLDFCGTICNNLGSHLETAERETLLARMQWVLGAKYAGLDSPALRACLLYFCTFSGNRPIRRNSLIRRWLAEGLAERRPRLKCSLLKEEYNSLWTLIDQNIIRPVEVSNNGRVKRCQPSGMVLEYITCKAIAEKRVLFPYQEEPHPQFTRWLSLHEGTGDFSNYYPRTLVVSGQAGADVLGFPNCELMQVLDLEKCSDLEDHHLERICNLFLLKYLSLGTKVTVLPRTITRLELLQTLDLRETAVAAVPIEVIWIPELSHLLGKFQLREGDHPQQERKMSKLEEFLRRKSKLETLAGFIVRSNRGFPQLMHLMGRLMKVKIICHSDSDCTNLVDLSKAIRGFISDGTGMHSPKDRSMSIEFHEDSCSANFLNSPLYQDFTASLQNAHGSLGSLKLRGPGALLSQILPITINLRALTELCLYTNTTLSWNDVVVVAQSDVLRFMKLEATQIEGPAVIERQQFKALKRISFVVDQRMPQISIEDGVNPNNKALKLVESLHLICEHLDGLSGIQITHLTGLKEVVLHPRLAPAIVNDWKAAARRHPNRPNVSN